MPEKLLLPKLPIAGTWLLYVFFITNPSHTLCFIHSRPICIESPGVTRSLRDLGTTLGSITARHIYTNPEVAFQESKLCGERQKFICACQTNTLYLKFSPRIKTCSVTLSVKIRRQMTEFRSTF